MLQPEEFDVGRITWGDTVFERFDVDQANPLKDLVRRRRMRPADKVLVVERAGKRLAFSLYQMTYHHVAQGELAGQPFILSFCAICHSATTMVPVLDDGKLYHFTCVGVYNGMALLRDDETGSYWDHISGECLHGPNKGEVMELIPVEHITVEQALKRWPDLKISYSIQPWHRRWILEPVMNLFGDRGIFPPKFRLSMGKKDTRLPEMVSGLGVHTKKTKRFYTIGTIQEAGGELKDRVDGRPVTVSLSLDGYPQAVFDGSEEKPMQLYCRWYGFSFTFPGCELFGEPPEAKEETAASAEKTESK
ncbi:DUF3179 domain-containing (seleno)protein [Desmospora profundinema]|uniref:DUF3179 domain-containing protein n=1 Tax=Desmospora profundinema TaxID=1571184 RepID=A0ABU1IR64_9BACL|nr:DUF3179 domain-containing (seleno)protein [Desmospora profundinema]MDR6227213.1 hypothetical protein [Desmospora profundinema]